MNWHWPRIDTENQETVSLGATVALLDQLRVGPPGSAVLQFLAERVPMDYLSLVEYADGAPRQLEGQARGQAARDTTARCFALYRSAFFRSDEVTGLAQDVASGHDGGARVDLFHYRQRDIPDRDWRTAIFVREQLAGRVSLVFSGEGRRAYALNLYRHLTHGEFSLDELERLRAVAPLVRAALQSHLRGAKPADPDRLATASSRLAEVASHLSKRELQVSARIVAGLTTDGIAQDLGIASSTVLTLRKRAYAKLKVNSRMALAWYLD